MIRSKLAAITAFVLAFGVSFISASQARAVDDTIVLYPTFNIINNWVPFGLHSNNNALSVTEQNCDYDVSYVRTDVPGNTDLYTAQPINQPLPYNKFVKKIEIVACAASWKGFGMPKMRSILNYDNQTFNGAEFSVIGSNYANYYSTFQINNTIASGTQFRIGAEYRNGPSTGIKLSNLKAIITYVK